MRWGRLESRVEEARGEGGGGEGGGLLFSVDVVGEMAEGRGGEWGSRGGSLWGGKGKG